MKMNKLVLVLTLWRALSSSYEEINWFSLEFIGVNERYQESADYTAAMRVPMRCQNTGRGTPRLVRREAAAYV
jgi:hypothetical protein